MIQISEQPRDYYVIDRNNLWAFITLKNMMILMMKIISNKDTNNNHLLIFYLKPLKAIKRNENDLFGISLKFKVWFKV